MKVAAPAILMGVLLASSVSTMIVGEARAEEQAVHHYELKIDGMT